MANIHTIGVFEIVLNNSLQVKDEKWHENFNVKEFLKPSDCLEMLAQKFSQIVSQAF